MSDPTIARKSAVVTGGASGIGRSVALRLAKNGLQVAILDLDPNAGRLVADEICAAGGVATAVAADVADGDAVTQAIAAARRELGPLQVLINGAGISDFTPFAQLSAGHWQRMIGVHLNGAFFCIQAVLADMTSAGWGRIVNIASVAGLNGGGPALAHYAAAKGGMIALAKALAHELGPAGITVNALAPGLIDTPMVRQTTIGIDLLERMPRLLPVRRVGTPADIAAACAFLVSDEASFVTGQVLSPNGGAYL